MASFTALSVCSLIFLLALHAPLVSSLTFNIGKDLIARDQRFTVRTTRADAYTQTHYMYHCTVCVEFSDGIYRLLVT